MGQLLLPADDLGRESAPLRWRQASRLFETAGEVALMGEAGVGSDLGQLAAAGHQAALGLVDLTAQQEVLGGLPDQIGEATVKVEWAEVSLEGDIVQRWVLVELLLHVFE